MNNTATLEEAAQSIRNWNSALRNGHVRIKNIFQHFVGFRILQGQLPVNPGGEFFHMYIGLPSELATTPEFFLMDSSLDNARTLGDQGMIYHYTELIDSIPSPIGPAADPAVTEIEDPEAHLRIYNWNGNNPNWIDSMYGDEQALFQAWKIPCDDLENTGEGYEVYFGLIISEKPPQSDLVIKGQTTQTCYYDLVRPVPPFKSGYMSEFCLLMYALGR